MNVARDNAQVRQNFKIFFNRSHHHIIGIKPNYHNYDLAAHFCKHNKTTAENQTAKKWDVVLRWCAGNLKKNSCNAKNLGEKKKSEYLECRKIQKFTNVCMDVKRPFSLYIPNLGQKNALVQSRKHGRSSCN